MFLVLFKLTFKNAKKSSKDYLIYLITITLSFSFIFAFNIVSSSKEIINLCEVMENFQYAMYIVNCFIVIVVGFLIYYTTNFIFQKRSKEFGTYLLLGIKKKQITKMFVIENIILGLISLLISFPIGYLFSMILSTIIMNIFELPNIIKINISSSVIILICLYFIIIYIIVLGLSSWRMKKTRVYNLLYLEKQNERRKKQHKAYKNIIFILSLISGAIAMYLFDTQFKKAETDPSMFIIFISILLIIISIYGTTFTLSDILLSFVLKRKNIKYKEDYLYIAKTFYSKAKTMSFTLGTLAVLVTLTLISLNLSSLFKGMFDYQLKIHAPYDISVETEEKEINKYLNKIEKNYTIEEKLIYHTYKNNNNNVSKQLERDGSWRDNDQVIKLSDYNKLLKLKQEQPVTLKKNEYLLHITKEYRKKLGNNKNLKTITLSNNKTLKQKEVIDKNYTYAWGAGYGFAVIVPDSATKGLEKQQTHLIVNTKEETTEKFAKDLTKLTEPDLCQENDQGYQICYSLSNIIVRGQEKATSNGFVTITAFICYYIAFIFTAVVGTILAIQSLSDASKYKYRYQVLNKLGVRKQQLYQTIKKQLSIFFLFPIIYPTIISIITITSMNKIFQIALETDKIYLTYFFLNLCIFLMFYMIYFIATYFGFKKIVDE